MKENDIIWKFEINEGGWGRKSYKLNSARRNEWVFYIQIQYIVIDIEGETGEGKDYFELRQPGRLIMQALAWSEDSRFSFSTPTDCKNCLSVYIYKLRPSVWPTL